jgi:hypothetical protein
MMTSTHKHEVVAEAETEVLIEEERGRHHVKAPCLLDLPVPSGPI